MKEIVMYGVGVLLFSFFCEFIIEKQPRRRCKKIIKEVCQKLRTNYHVSIRDLNFEDVIKGTPFYLEFLEAFENFCHEKKVSLEYVSLNEDYFYDIRHNGAKSLIRECWDLVTLSDFIHLSITREWIASRLSCDVDQDNLTKESYDTVIAFIRLIAKRNNINLQHLGIGEGSIDFFRRHL